MHALGRLAVWTDGDAEYGDGLGRALAAPCRVSPGERTLAHRTMLYP
jgi:hypothetical protein